MTPKQQKMVVTVLAIVMIISLILPMISSVAA